MRRRLMLAALGAWRLHGALAQDAAGRAHYRVPASELYEALSRRFPLRFGLAGLLEVQVSAPSLLLLPARNLLGATLVTSVSNLQLAQAGTGETDLAFKLRYEPRDQTLRAHHPQVLDLRWPGLPRDTRQGLMALLPGLAQQVGEFVLHRFEPGELGLADVMGLEPQEIAVREDGLEIFFQPRARH